MHLRLVLTNSLVSHISKIPLSPPDPSRADPSMSSHSWPVYVRADCSVELQKRNLFYSRARMHKGEAPCRKKKKQRKQNQWAPENVAFIREFTYTVPITLEEGFEKVINRSTYEKRRKEDEKRSQVEPPLHPPDWTCGKNLH